MGRGPLQVAQLAVCQMCPPQDLRRKNWALNDQLEKLESSSQSLAAADSEEKLCAINDLKDRNSKLLSHNNVCITPLLLAAISRF